MLIAMRGTDLTELYPVDAERQHVVCLGVGADAKTNGIALGYKAKAGKNACAIGAFVEANNDEFIIGKWNISDLVKRG